MIDDGVVTVDVVFIDGGVLCVVWQDIKLEMRYLTLTRDACIRSGVFGF